MKRLHVVVHFLALKSVYQCISTGVNDDPTDMSCPLAKGHLRSGIAIVGWQITKCIANKPVTISRKRLEQGIDVINSLRKDDTPNGPQKLHGGYESRFRRVEQYARQHVGAAAMTNQEHTVRVIARQGLAAVGPRPREEESEQFEDVLRVCRVLQFVVRRGQSVVRHDHR